MPRIAFESDPTHYLRLRNSLLPATLGVTRIGGVVVFTQSHLHLSTRGPAAFKADEHLLQAAWQSLLQAVAPSSSVFGLHAAFGDGIAAKHEHICASGWLVQF